MTTITTTEPTTPTEDEEDDEWDPPMEQEQIREMFPEDYRDPDEDE